MVSAPCGRLRLTYTLDLFVLHQHVRLVRIARGDDGATRDKNLHSHSPRTCLRVCRRVPDERNLVELPELGPSLGSIWFP